MNTVRQTTTRCPIRRWVSILAAITLLGLPNLTSAGEPVSVEPTTDTTTNRIATFVRQRSDAGNYAMESPEEVAWRWLSESMRWTPMIEQHLANEQAMLSAAQSRLAAQIIDIPKPIREYAEDLETQVVFALIRERMGDHEESIAALHQALRLAESIPEEAGYVRSRQLLDIAERLARQGDFDGAVKAALDMATNDDEGVNITATGVVDLPHAAAQSYALLIVTKLQADAAQFASAVKTTDLIEDRNSKCAALWLVALKQAEARKLEDALVTADSAISKSGRKYFWSQPQMVPEFTIAGPSLVNLDAFRAMALSEIAVQNALDGKDEQVTASLDRIDNLILRNAASVEVVAELAKQQRADLATKWVSKVPQGQFRSIAQYHLTHQLILNREYDVAADVSKDITSADWRARFEIDFCDLLRKENDAERLVREFDKAEEVIGLIRLPAARARALIDLANVQINAGRPDAALRNLKLSQELVQDVFDASPQRANAFAEIAASIAKAGAKPSADRLFDAALKQARQLEAFTGSESLMKIVSAQLESDYPLPSVEELGRTIPDASWRSQALTAVAVRYAQHQAISESRRVFCDAFDSAMEITDFMGIDTPYSKGGAIRLIGRAQAECDLDGLLKYIESSENPNVVAYGYFAAAEAQIPNAVKQAENRGSLFPHGVLDSLWEKRTISKIVSPN